MPFRSEYCEHQNIKNNLTGPKTDHNYANSMTTPNTEKKYIINLNRQLMWDLRSIKKHFKKKLELKNSGGWKITNKSLKCINN